MPYKYIFWDSDNTLVDTFSLHWAKHLHVLKNNNISLDEKFKRRIHENNGVQNWAWISGELGLAIQQDQYLSEIDSWYKDNSHQLNLRDGILEALNYIKSKNLKQCVVSNGRRSSVPVSHQATGIGEYFEFVLCKEDYKGRKPEPAPFLTAIGKMEELTGAAILTDECLAIDDDPLGVESAKRASMTTIFRPTDLVEQVSEFADYTILKDEDFLPLLKKLI